MTGKQANKHTSNHDDDDKSIVKAERTNKTRADTIFPLK